MDLHAAEMQPDVIAQALVVIAGDVNETRALAHATHQLLQYVVVRLHPMRAAPHLPEIDDVAHQIDGLGLHTAEELEQLTGLASLGPEVDVRDEQGAVSKSWCRQRSGSRSCFACLKRAFIASV